MSKTVAYRTFCHPEADGRRPRMGDQQWTFKFILEDQTLLLLHMGRESRDQFGQFILDELADVQSHSDGKTADEVVSNFMKLCAATDRVAELESQIKDMAAATTEATAQVAELQIRHEQQVAAMNAHYQAEMRAAWEAGFQLCRTYGDNSVHFQGDQKERQWEKFTQRKDLP